MSKISATEVERIARLARIGLTADEAATMSQELGRIIEFVEQLGKVDTTSVKPTDQVTGLVDVTRPDIVRPSMPRDALLAIAPASRDGYIEVKRVLNG
jgi:aspartyl-tRNA(Asn)/glutamyl-tRNA(Gln) amidotransferase subunit C